MDQRRYFNERLSAALGNHFETVETKTVKTEFTGEKQQYHDPHINFFGNFSGRYGRLADHTEALEHLPLNHCLEVSQLELVIAKRSS